MLIRLYRWLYDHARSRHAPHVMAVISFLDSSMLPIPPHPFLAMLAMARPDKAYTWALLCTLASVMGGFLGYLIGDVLFETVGQWIVATYGYQSKIEAFHEVFAEWGFWIIVVKGLTPIPFKIVTIGAGIAQFSLLPFFIASVASRGMQFFALAWLLRHSGSKIDVFARKYGERLGWAAIVLVIGLVLYFR